MAMFVRLNLTSLIWDFPFCATAVNLAVYSPSGMTEGTDTTLPQLFNFPAAPPGHVRLNVLAWAVPWNSVTLTVSAYRVVPADTCAVAPPDSSDGIRGTRSIGVETVTGKLFTALFPSSATAAILNS